jgi:hypothetical protein
MEIKSFFVYKLFELNPAHLSRAHLIKSITKDNYAARASKNIQKTLNMYVHRKPGKKGGLRL